MKLRALCGQVVVNDGGCGGCGGYYPAYGYYDPYGYYPAYGYYDPYYYPAYTGYYYTYPTYYTYAEAPALTGAEGAAVQTQGDASVLGTAHTTHLVADDFVWTRGYAWYPDTPGQYPESKWDWYERSVARVSVRAAGWVRERERVRVCTAR